LPQISDEIFGLLDAYRVPDESLWDASRRAFLFGGLDMASRGRWTSDSLDGT
jgi:hypothetical protein